MNTAEVRRRLEALGAAMEWIILVPKGGDVPGWKREDMYNLIETEDGYVVSAYERGRVRAAHSFSDIEAACQDITRRSQRSASRSHRGSPG